MRYGQFSNVRKNKYLLDFELPDDFEDFDSLSDDLVQKGILENHHEIIVFNKIARR